MANSDPVPEDEADEKGSRKPNPVDIHVGGRVRFRRMLLGMSQEKLGERLGLTFQQVQKYEKGVNRIGASRLFDLSQVLQVPIQFFYEEAPGTLEQSSAEHAAGFADRSGQLRLLFDELGGQILSGFAEHVVNHAADICIYFRGGYLALHGDFHTAAHDSASGGGVYQSVSDAQFV